MIETNHNVGVQRNSETATLYARIMHYLAASDEAPTNEVAQHCNVSNHRAGTVLGHMARLGLVERLGVVTPELTTDTSGKKRKQFQWWGITPIDRWGG